MSKSLKKIIVATDGSEEAKCALRAAVDLAKHDDTELHIAHAWQAIPPYSHPAIAVATDLERCEKEARELLFEQLDAIKLAGRTVTSAHLLKGNPPEKISDLADRVGADLVITGSRILGIVRRFILRSVSESVVGMAPCAVLIVRDCAHTWPPARVLIADDSSESSKRAGELATEIANSLEANTLLLRAHHVFADATEAARFRENQAVPPEVALRRHELSLFHRADALERKYGRRPKTSVREGDAASVILEAVKESEESTLIAVGSRRLGLLDRLRLGSVSMKVLRALRNPVLIHPP